MQFLTIYIDFKGKMVGIWLLFTDKLITCGQKWLFLTLVDISKKCGQKWKFCAKTEKTFFS